MRGLYIERNPNRMQKCDSQCDNNFASFARNLETWKCGVSHIYCDHMFVNGGSKSYKGWGFDQLRGLLPINCCSIEVLPVIVYQKSSFLSEITMTLLRFSSLSVSGRSRYPVSMMLQEFASTLLRNNGILLVLRWRSIPHSRSGVWSMHFLLRAALYG